LPARKLRVGRQTPTERGGKAIVATPRARAGRGGRAASMQTEWQVAGKGAELETAGGRALHASGNGLVVKERTEKNEERARSRSAGRQTLVRRTIGTKEGSAESGRSTVDGTGCGQACTPHRASPQKKKKEKEGERALESGWINDTAWLAKMQATCNNVVYEKMTVRSPGVWGQNRSQTTRTARRDAAERWGRRRRSGQ
jgi:hypothetical protein